MGRGRQFFLERGGETGSGQFCEKKLRWQRTVAAPQQRGGMCVAAGLWEEKEGSFETLLQCSSLIFDAQQTGKRLGLSARSPLKLETMRPKKRDLEENRRRLTFPTSRSKSHCLCAGLKWLLVSKFMIMLNPVATNA